MKKLELYFFGFVLATALFLGSCDTVKEPIPAYVHIKPFIINVNSNQGTAASKITDAWVNFEETGDFLGVYEVPSTFPIIAEGKTKLLIDPGILENGIKSTPNIYPFLKRYKVEVDLEPGKIDTIQPVTQYDSRVIFHYLEDFDSGNSLNVTFDTNSTLAVIRQDGVEAFEGKSAKFTLDENNPVFEVATSEKMELPTDGKLGFLELHYKNEGILEVGLVGYRNSDPAPLRAYFFALNPQSEWNKIYIDLTNELIESADDIETFQILFGAQLPTGQTSATYMIDNIKVLEFDN